MRINAGVSLFVLALLYGAATPIGAQRPPRTVADGIYTDAQATRGANAYDTACSRCHRSDLGGADGPPLKDDRFNRDFAGKDLQRLYERITKTMPRGAAASLPDGIYLDILAFLMRENGFPAGSQELSADALEDVEVLATRTRPLPAVGDFSFVEVAGCLVEPRPGVWMLEKAGDPVAVSATVSLRAEPVRPASRAAGHSFRLIDALAYAPQEHKGQLMSVRGILIRVPGEQRLAISSLETLASSCE